MLYTVCFSPTGGTRRAAAVVMAGFEAKGQWLDLNRADVRAEVHAFSKNDFLIVALPVYGGQIPLADSMLSGLKGDRTPCVLLACYGNRHYDDALAQMKKQMTDQGFLPIGGAAVIIPHVFSEKLGANRPHQQDREKLTEFSKTIQKKLQDKDYSLIEVPGNSEIRPVKASAMPRMLDLQRCMHCGLCARVCPVQAIDETTLAFHQERCLHCMSCKVHCQQQAISFDDASVRHFLEANFLAPRNLEFFI